MGKNAPILVTTKIQPVTKFLVPVAEMKRAQRSVRAGAGNELSKPTKKDQEKRHTHDWTVLDGDGGRLFGGGRYAAITSAKHQ